MRKQQKIQPGDRIEQGAPDSLASLAQEVGRCETAAPPVNQLAQDPELVQEFLMEAREHLSHIEGLMIEIESGASNAEAVNGVFRSFHTIKGLAGFLDYEVIQSVAHEVETLLDKARTGALMLTPARVEAVLRAGDYIGSWLRYIEDQPPARRRTTYRWWRESRARWMKPGNPPGSIVQLRNRPRRRRKKRRKRWLSGWPKAAPESRWRP